MSIIKSLFALRLRGFIVAVSIFFFNATATTVIYTLSLHDALPIFLRRLTVLQKEADKEPVPQRKFFQDRKSTRLNSSHQIISYAVFCLEKNNTPTISMNLSHCTHQPHSGKASTRLHSGGLQQS